MTKFGSSITVLLSMVEIPRDHETEVTVEELIDRLREATSPVRSPFETVTYTLMKEPQLRDKFIFEISHVVEW